MSLQVDDAEHLRCRARRPAASPPSRPMRSSVGLQLRRRLRRPRRRPSAVTASPAPLRRRVPSHVDAAHARLRGERDEARLVRRELVLAQAVLLGEHDDRAALGRLVGERRRAARPRRARASTRRASGRTPAAWRLPSVIVPVLSSSSTSTSPDASTARPDSASTLRRTSRSMPAMPIALQQRADRRRDQRDEQRDQRRHRDRRCRRTSANGRSVDDDDEEDRASGRRAGSPSAISFGVLRRSAPSTSAIMRSRKLWPGSCVISTTIRSESTRVPPVTALRSPPDSRITGADSPVIADSSTDAMPSIDGAVAGDDLAGLDDDDVAAAQLVGRASSSPSAQPRDGVRAHRAQRVGLGPAAALGERLGEVGEDHRQPQPERDREREPGGLVAAAERRRRTPGRARRS